MPADHYATLQVDPRAETDVIQAAYRALARRCHPDLAGGSHERMIALNEAWSVLRDPATRAAYDRARLAAGYRQAAPAVGGPDGREPRRSSEPAATVLDFGRYTGWSLDELAHHDPDFLEWLARTPIGRTYRSEIERLLSRPGKPAPTMRPRARQPAWARFR
ncbi:MAG: DnaJ domain-containing protein [Chloroflexi bacterium]|nr:DnaJ domain-containing protein [Chloroflexota bacterium]